MLGGKWGLEVECWGVGRRLEVVLEIGDDGGSEGERVFGWVEWSREGDDRGVVVL